MIITISKKKLNEYLSLSNDLVIEVLEENKNSYKILIMGDKNKMKSKDNGFSQKQLEQLKELLNPFVQRLDKIEYRLNVLEKDVNQIKLLPSIQKELKNSK